ncbi:MAG: hypothetical protein QOI64_2372 [Solirubrobacteraceae bacterium]|nr:hypothetical protein [Solirubrobacteraceae bacterium]
MLSRLLARGPRDLLWQIVLFCGAYWLYRLVRGEVFTESAAAFDHARQIVDLERALHVFVEPQIQQWAIGAGWIDDVGSWMYLNTHFVVTTCTLAFIYLFRNEHFYFVRNMFMVAMGLALIGYALYPTAPPRLFPGDGFTDTISTFTGVAQDSTTASLLVNKYAAVPSMHIAFSLMIAVPAAALSRHSVARTLWSAYPLCVFFVIVATGNHFWFDAAAGAAVACLAVLGARALARVRPDRWAWPEATREATV